MCKPQLLNARIASLCLSIMVLILSLSELEKWFTDYSDLIVARFIMYFMFLN